MAISFQQLNKQIFWGWWDESNLPEHSLNYNKQTDI